MKADTDQALLSAALRQDLGTFIAKVFQTVSPADHYVHNWHIDAISHELARVFLGETQRLIITQPPRSLKSISTSVAFVAWMLGHDPTLRFACVSYAGELAAALARQFRLVVTSEWYRRVFPAVRLSKDTEMECVTTAGGGRMAVTVGGSFTGRGADIIIIDDPMKAEDAQSELGRRAVAEWYKGTLVSRLNNKKKGVIILVMQRLHEDDLAGQLLRGGGWQHLDLPAIAEDDEEIALGDHVFHRRKKGEALQPDRESLEVLEAIKREMGSMAFSAQYLQRPVPSGGNLIRREWLKYYDAKPTVQTGDEIVQSWDIASTLSATSDYSVCSTWLSRRRSYYLLDIWRGQLEFPYLRPKLIALAGDARPNRILIEEAGPGLHLIQDLKANPVHGIPLPVGIRPEGDKLVRMEAQSARFEAGQVYLPRETPWLADLVRELMAFPHGRHDDQVDSISQYLNWAETPRYERTVSIFGPKIIYG